MIDVTVRPVVVSDGLLLELIYCLAQSAGNRQTIAYRAEVRQKLRREMLRWNAVVRSISSLRKDLTFSPCF